MSTIYEALIRIQKLYQCKGLAPTAKLLDMPTNTYYDNKCKAKKDFDNIQQLKSEKNPIKKELLEKAISQSKKKFYSNALYHQFVELGIKDNLNLNWIFYNHLPVHNNNSDKIAKIVKTHYLKEYISADSVAIKYFEDINMSLLDNLENDEVNFIILPKSMIKNKNLRAFKYKDDSMAPNIKSDCIIFVDMTKTKLKKACVYVVKYNELIYVRRLEEIGDSILLRADNLSYNTITASKENMTVIGQVIDTISTGNIEC